MSVRIAAFNLNNLFSRASVLELPGFSRRARKILDDVEELGALIDRPSYEGKTRSRIHELLEAYGIGVENGHEPWFDVVQARRRLYSVGRKGDLRVVAAGRDDWVGWVELRRSLVAEPALANTARVVRALEADVLCAVEVEDRTTLARFNRAFLGPDAFAHNMLVDGNDDRGIDVGILSRFPIRGMRSHIHDRYLTATRREEPLFSRDCAEYHLVLPGGRPLVMLLNHFKSRGYGAQNDNDDRRRRQARRVRDLVSRHDLERDLVVVAGDLNDTPDSEALRDLLETPYLHDVLDALPPAAARWTYRDGRDQIDYLLVSAPLRERLLDVGIERRGIWSRDGALGKVPMFPEVTDLATQASDHAAVWAAFDV